MPCQTLLSTSRAAVSLVPVLSSQSHTFSRDAIRRSTVICRVCPPASAITTTATETPHFHQQSLTSQNHKHFTCATLGSHWTSTRSLLFPSHINLLLQYYSVAHLQLHPRTCIPKQSILASQLKYLIKLSRCLVTSPSSPRTTQSPT